VRAKERCSAGGLGTWATNIIDQFTLKDDLWRAVFEKLQSTDATEQYYVFTYFMSHVENSFDAPPFQLVRAVTQGLEAGDTRFKEVVEGWQTDGWEERKPEDPWRKQFADALAKFEPTPQAFELSDDDIPF
jgi:hypothetical protein